MTATNLFFKNAGPLMRYRGGVLTIDDLNPEGHMQWRLSRWELFTLGLKAMLAAVRL